MLAEGFVDLFARVSGWFGERSLLADTLWQTTLLLGAGLLAARLLAARPARAHAVLLACSVAALAAPLLALAARELGLGLLGAPSLDTSLAAPPPTDEVARSAGPGLARTLQALSLVVWFTGASLLSIRLALGMVRSARLAARIGHPAPPLAERMARRAARRRGLTRLPRVLEAAPDVAPSVWAWSRPARLFLPPQSQASELSAAIHHELGHLQRRDHLACLAAHIVAAVLFWHPLAWFARRRAAALAEQACDEWALASGAPPAAMARALVSAVPTADAGVAFGLSLKRDRRLLEERIERVFATSRPRPRAGRAWACVLIACVSGLLAGVALAQRAAPTPGRGDEATRPQADRDAWEERIAELRATGVVDVVALPAEVDLGRVAPGSTPAGKLWLVNPGESPRAILGVKTGCGCTRVHLPEPAIVPAGGVLELDVDQDAEPTPDTSKSKLVTLRIEGQDPIQVPVKTHTTRPDPEKENL